MPETQTNPTLLLPPEPERLHSSWGLRLIFGLLLAVLLVETVTVLAFVGFTWMKVSDAHGRALRVAESIRPTWRKAGALATEVVEPTPNPNVWDRHGPLNILLMGLDVDDCLNPGGTTQRTDVLILVRIDPTVPRVAMMSIPRDLLVYIEGLVNIQGYSEAKINTAHVWGTLASKDPQSGPAWVKKTVEDNLGLPVHRYVRVDMQGFKKIIEAVDGVDIDVPPSSGNPKVGLYDPEYPDGHCGVMTVSFKPGRQHLDADRALQYARSRHTTSDFDRSRRQIQVLMAIRDRALRLNTLLDIHQLLPAALDTVTTDLTPAEIVALIPTAQKIDPLNIARLPIGEDEITDERRMIGDTSQWVLLLKQDRFNSLRLRFLATGAPVPGLETPTPKAAVGSPLTVTLGTTQTALPLP